MTSQIAIQFTYDPSGCNASQHQISLLLEGFGYYHIKGVNEDNGTITLSAMRLSEVELDEHEWQVKAIQMVIGEPIDIDYYRLEASEWVCYTALGEIEYRTVEE